MSRRGKQQSREHRHACHHRAGDVSRIDQDVWRWRSRHSKSARARQSRHNATHFASFTGRIAELPGFDSEDEHYFRDVYDHPIRLSSNRQLSGPIVERDGRVYVNRVELPQWVMIQLAIFATVFLPVGRLVHEKPPCENVWSACQSVGPGASILRAGESVRTPPCLGWHTNGITPIGRTYQTSLQGECQPYSPDRRGDSGRTEQMGETREQSKSLSGP